MILVYEPHRRVGRGGSLATAGGYPFERSLAYVRATEGFDVDGRLREIVLEAKTWILPSGNRVSVFATSDEHASGEVEDALRRWREP